ncbi:TrmB family transcriptional regulator [Bacillus cereus group sp. BfR-BA-01446]|uniref:TrmB family transcriptional regulator n=1 Tax=Bacillus cereus group TaxID=86661 RepID=UPI001F57F327|nr:helix-turn-helix domain-containing protein [Bacillus cereus group sp. BfR-BA-01446]MCU5059611.1 HTH domain-containing protein [Bacillus cereus]
MIEQLRNIGLSDLEARCYLTLHEESNLSGYEIAKRVSVSRTNVYAALRSLTDKGMCRAIEANPILYDAVPIDQLIRLLKSDFEQSAKVLLEELNTPPRDAGLFYNWQGDKSIKLTIKRLVSNADKSIVVDIWAEDIHWVEEALVDAEERGLAVTLITIGECHSRLKNVLTHKRNDEWNHMESRKFSILCDAHSSLIGSFGKKIKLSALETNHPSVIELLKNGFYHDVIMEKIEQDFANELEDKYGNNYQKIIRNYMEILD